MGDDYYICKLMKPFKLSQYYLKSFSLLEQIIDVQIPYKDVEVLQVFEYSQYSTDAKIICSAP